MQISGGGPQPQSSDIISGKGTNPAMAAANRKLQFYTSNNFYPS